MGGQDIRRNPTADAIREFSWAVLRDVEALELMLSRGLIERGASRVGAEQELFLTDTAGNPVPLALQLLEDLDDDRFTTEIALFNLEINLPPLAGGPALLSRFRRELEGAVRKADAAARARGARIVLTGILPTLTKSHLTMANLTPAERYHALNEAVMKRAGGRILLRLQGMDELRMEHDSVMVESCNTSFQLHYQVDPDEFAAHYNLAQAVLGPVLASAANSPLLFGRRLWSETRIGLFQQAVDTRAVSEYPRDRLPRVWFGESWVHGGAVEVFRENILRYRLLLAGVAAEDPFAVLAEGGTPALSALQLHNGTIYRWNRPCYGVTDGQPHLRIECRGLPSGPTLVDEVGNAAFWFGLMAGGLARFGDVRQRMPFDVARANFMAAARTGLDAGFEWFDGERLSAPELIRDRLLPTARLGLRMLRVDEGDADRSLEIVERRVLSGATGARWLVRSDRALRDKLPLSQRMATLTACLTERGLTDAPVASWPVVNADDTKMIRTRFDRVEQCMTTDLFTVPEHDSIDVVAFIMNERGVRQLLVEDDEGRLAGIISYRSLLRVLALGRVSSLGASVPARDIMVREFVTVTPDTPTLHAIRLMIEHGVTALPVIQNDQLVGIVSEHDFLPVMAELLHERDSVS